MELRRDNQELKNKVQYLADELTLRNMVLADKIDIINELKIRIKELKSLV